MYKTRPKDITHVKYTFCISAWPMNNGIKNEHEKPSISPKLSSEHISGLFTIQHSLKYYSRDSILRFKTQKKVSASVNPMGRCF